MRVRMLITFASPCPPPRSQSGGGAAEGGVAARSGPMMAAGRRRRGAGAEVTRGLGGRCAVLPRVTERPSAEGTGGGGAPLWERREGSGCRLGAERGLGSPELGVCAVPSH